MRPSPASAAVRAALAALSLGLASLAPSSAHAFREECFDVRPATPRDRPTPKTAPWRRAPPKGVLPAVRRGAVGTLPARMRRMPIECVPRPTRELRAAIRAIDPSRPPIVPSRAA